MMQIYFYYFFTTQVMSYHLQYTHWFVTAIINLILLVLRANQEIIMEVIKELLELEMINS